MLDIEKMVLQLKRPRLLVSTAQISATTYRGINSLQKMLGINYVPKTAEAILLLLEAEHEVNKLRLDQAVEFVVEHHISLLSAIMAETENFRQNKTKQD